nr:hypothetical protein [Micromonospora sp. DSM 115978]
LTVWLPAAVLSGIGIGMTMPTLGSAAAASLPPASFAVGNAVNASFRQFGAVLGVSVFVAVLGTPTFATATDSFHRVWFVLAAVSALTDVLCAGVRTPRAPTATFANA